METRNNKSKLVEATFWKAADKFKGNIEANKASSTLGTVESKK